MAEFSELLKRAKSGDREALAEIHAVYVERTKAVVRRRLSPLVRRQFDTTDIGQSVFVEVLRDLPTFEDRGEEAFRHWLFLKAENKVRAKLRKLLRPEGGRREATLSSVVEEAAPGADAGAVTCIGEDEAEGRDHCRLRALIADLPDDQRQIVDMRDIQDLSYAAIAERLGLASDDAARMRHARALLALKRRWKTNGPKPR